jgi:hypothetical protein
MMMTITELELVLFVAFVVMTYMYFKLRGEIYLHRRITGEIFIRIAKGQIRVVESDEGRGFDLEEVKR